MPSKKTVYAPDDAFIRDWLKDGEAVQVSVDNQIYFSVPHYFGSSSPAPLTSTQPVQNFCRNLGRVTGKIGKKLRTVSIQAEVGKCATQRIHSYGLQTQTLCYDAQALKLLPLGTKMPGRHLREMTVDLYDTHYMNHYVHIKNGQLWEYDGGRAKNLRRCLDGFDSNKQLVNGLYGEACVLEYIQGACKKNDIMVDPHWIWSMNGGRFTLEQAREQFDGKAAVISAPGQVKRVMRTMGYDL